MTNYTYGWHIKAQGYTEVPESEYTESMMDMKNFIDHLSNIVEEAKCGWTKLKYEAMCHANYGVMEYMVLYEAQHDVRWIPINGNSKALNLQVLGENIW